MITQLSCIGGLYTNIYDKNIKHRSIKIISHNVINISANWQWSVLQYIVGRRNISISRIFQGSSATAENNKLHKTFFCCKLYYCYCYKDQFALVADSLFKTQSIKRTAENGVVATLKSIWHDPLSTGWTRYRKMIVVRRHRLNTSKHALDPDQLRHRGTGCWIDLYPWRHGHRWTVDWSRLWLDGDCWNS